MPQRIDYQHLDNILGELQKSSSIHTRNAEIAQQRIEAENNSIDRKSRAHLGYWNALALGTKVGIILIAAGILAVLLAYAASLILAAWKKPYSAVSYESLKPVVEKITAVESKLSNQNLDQSLIEIQTQINNLKKLAEVTSSQTDTSSLTVASNLQELKAEIQGLKASENNMAQVKTSVNKLLIEVEGVQQAIERISKNDLLEDSGLSEDNQSQLNTKNETKKLTVKSINSAGLGLIPYDENSKSCPENISYRESCYAKYEYPDGQVYEGMWVNGVPSGKGKFTFSDGTFFKATWKKGLPLNINESEIIKPMRSVTYFTSIKSSKISSAFREIVVGHNFTRSDQDRWENAYCYTYFENSMGGLERLMLSEIESYSSQISKSKFPFKQEKFSKLEFKKAQEMCPYQYTNFRTQ